MRRVLRGLLPVLILVAARVLAQSGGPLIVPLDAEGYKKLVAGAHGHPLVVNFWATWCVPCVEEFPDLLKLRERYGKRGLEVALVSIDRQRDAETVVREFLRRHNVGFETYIKRSGDDEGFINAVSPGWSGALPATAIFDAQGTLRYLLVDRQTIDGLSTLVEPLLVMKR